MAVGAIFPAKTGKAGKQGMLSFGKSDIFIRIDSQCAQCQDDLCRAFCALIPIEGIQALFIHCVGKIVKAGLDHLGVIIRIGCQRLQRHGGNINIGGSCRQAKAAVRLLGGYDSLYHIFPGKPGVLRCLRLTGIQSQQRIDPSVQTLRADGFSFKGICTLSNQVNSRSIRLCTKAAAVAAQSHDRQCDAVICCRLDTVQLAHFRVTILYILLKSR